MSDTQPKWDPEQSWYYAHDGGALGPYARSSLEHLIKIRLLTGDDLVWSPDLSDWTPLKELEWYAEVLRTIRPAVPSIPVLSITEGQRYPLPDARRGGLRSILSGILFLLLTIALAAAFTAIMLWMNGTDPRILLR